MRAHDFNVLCIMFVSLANSMRHVMSFHRIDMTLAVAEALNPNKPNHFMQVCPKFISPCHPHMRVPYTLHPHPAAL